MKSPKMSDAGVKYPHGASLKCSGIVDKAILCNVLPLTWRAAVEQAVLQCGPGHILFTLLDECSHMWPRPSRAQMLPRCGLGALTPLLGAAPLLIGSPNVGTLVRFAPRAQLSDI